MNSRWDVTFKFTMLRLVSFNLDYYWSLRQSSDSNSVSQINIKSERGLTLTVDTNCYPTNSVEGGTGSGIIDGQRTCQSAMLCRRLQLFLLRGIRPICTALRRWSYYDLQRLHFSGNAFYSGSYITKTKDPGRGTTC